MSSAHPLDDLLVRYPELAPCRDAICTSVTLIATCYRKKGQLLLCGNGGSAADAEHWSGELLKGFCSLRPLTSAQKQTLPPELADRLQNGLAAIPLNGFLSLSSAFANDVSPELVYAQLVWALGRPADVLVGMSTSGNAANVLHAFQAAKAKGMFTVALTGAKGGKLAASGLCNACIRVPETETFKVQELHLPVYHTICLMLEEEFFNPNGPREGCEGACGK